MTGTLKAIDRTKYDITAFWYNPNIHPYQEYLSRFTNFKEFVERLEIPYLAEEEYGLRKFVKMVSNNLDNRCDKCYYDRIKKTALEAKKYGFDAFSTTLLVSPYQKHEKIRAMAQVIAKEVGVEFYYVDPRPFFREGNKEARDMGQYMQKYCGCVFSEEERYLKKYKTKS
jgi:predicted adenine nucleotide alpha hydrolase (AANH) superfamily ATPase